MALVEATQHNSVTNQPTISAVSCVSARTHSNAQTKVTREHPESPNLRQGQNLTGIVYHGGTYRLLVLPVNMLQGHRGWHRWIEHIRLPILFYSNVGRISYTPLSSSFTLSLQAQNQPFRQILPISDLLPRDAMRCKRGLCCHAVSVCLCLSVRPSVTFVDHVKTNKDIFEIFSPSGSDTILVFPS